MKTTTSNSITWLRKAFIVLTILSMVEMAGAALTDLPFLWGHTLWIVSAIIVLTYIILGRPYFRMDTTGDVLEFENGFSLFNFLDKYLIVRRDKVVNMSVKEHFFKRLLVVHYEEAGEILEISFEISFLSESQIEEITRDINRIMSGNIKLKYQPTV